MVAIVNSFIFALGVSAAAVVQKRDYATIRNDLNTINSDTVALTNTVNSYSGGFFGGLAVNNAANQLDNDIKSATTNAQNSAAGTRDESQAIIDYINNTLEPNIRLSINALKSKKSTFEADGTKSVVLSTTKQLKADSDTYGGALANLATSDLKSAAAAAQAKIDADFDDAIAAFSS